MRNVDISWVVVTSQNPKKQGMICHSASNSWRMEPVCFTPVALWEVTGVYLLLIGIKLSAIMRNASLQEQHLWTVLAAQLHSAVNILQKKRKQFSLCPRTLWQQKSLNSTKVTKWPRAIWQLQWILHHFLTCFACQSTFSVCMGHQPLQILLVFVTLQWAKQN